VNRLARTEAAKRRFEASFFFAETGTERPIDGRLTAGPTGDDHGGVKLAISGTMKISKKLHRFSPGRHWYQ